MPLRLRAAAIPPDQRRAAPSRKIQQSQRPDKSALSVILRCGSAVLSDRAG